jgi:hypothetical protein
VIARRPRLANRFLCLLEGAPKLTAANIGGLLSSLLHDAYNEDKKIFTYPDPGGARDGQRVRRIGYLPYVRLLGHISQQLNDDINGGRIKHIELIRSYEMRPFNDDPYMREETASLRIAVLNTMPREGKWQRIKDKLREGRGEYVSANISFVAPDGRVKDAEYNMENDTVANESYIRSKLITEISPHLADASLKVVDHLAARMRQILVDEG